MLKKLLLLGVLLGGGAWWLFYRSGWPVSFKARSARLENAVNRELNAAGIQDHHIEAQRRIEQRLWTLEWIENTRRIHSVDQQAVHSLQESLEDIAHSESVSVTRHVEKGLTTYEIRQGPWVFQRLVFAPVAEKTSSGAGPSGKRLRAALVIDDVAYSLTQMDRFAELKIPLTFAILPQQRFSKALAQKAHRQGFSVILHLPMEPLDVIHNDPGSHALYLRMNAAQLRQKFDADVASVPGLEGINNHMGSAFTSDEKKMDLVMQWVKEKQLFFLDSHTTAKSVVPKIAKRRGVPCLVNETFLDNEDSVAAIEKQLDVVMKLAQKQGQTIAIGHYRRKHIVEALTHKIPEFKTKGIDFVLLPSLYKR